MSLATIVKGNTFSLAIPLQVYAVEDGEVVLRDYTPESGDAITVRLKGERRNYTYIPSTNGNTAFIHLEGSEVVGMYAVEVEIVKDDDSKLTSMRFEQLSIVESIDELNEGQITEGIEQGAIYLDPEIFIAGKDGRGIVSIIKTSTIGLVDTYTITYTDNTTSTFNVTNGKDGINGQDGKDGADGQDGVGIASIAKTGTQGLVDTYTITLTNGTTYTYQVTNGKDGQDGTDGVGIVSITKTSTSGLVDTYTILLTNGTTTTFTVTNGSDATQVQSDWSQNDSTEVDYIKNKPTIPAAQVQSNWNESDTSSKAFIQNKPTIPTVPTNVSAFTNDAGYLNGNFCPIIEDTRSSAVAAITGVAPFGTNGTIPARQRIILDLKYSTAASTTLQLTLSDGSTTSAIPIKHVYNGNFWQVNAGKSYTSNVFLELIYDDINNAWVVTNSDSNSTPATMTQSSVDAGTVTNMSYALTPKLFHDNAYIVEETYSSGSLKANKMYDFGEVTTALVLPDLDVTNDLVRNAMNFWALHFKVGELTPAGTTELSITFPQNPSGIIVDDEPTIKEGDYVEIMITKHTVGNDTDYYASIKVWQAPSQNS